MNIKQTTDKNNAAYVILWCHSGGQWRGEAERACLSAWSVANHSLLQAVNQTRNSLWLNI